MRTKKFVRYIPEWLQDGDRINLLADMFIEKYNEFVNNLTELKEAIQVSTAEGTYLDDIGMMFKLSRYSGESDSNYRNRILSFWQAGKSTGTVADIKSALSLAGGINESDITITEIDNMKIKVEMDIGVDTYLADVVREVAWKSKPAGVWVVFDLTFGFTETHSSYSDSVSISDATGIYYGYTEIGEGEI